MSNILQRGRTQQVSDHFKLRKERRVRGEMEGEREREERVGAKVGGKFVFSCNVCICPILNKCLKVELA